MTDSNPSKDVSGSDSNPKDFQSLLNSVSEATLDPKDESRSDLQQEADQDEPDTSSATPTSSANAKRNKKKKLAAKLKKKLGGGSSSNQDHQVDPIESSSSGTSSHLILPNSNNDPTTSGPQLSNEQFDLMRKTVEKETNDPNLAGKLDNLTLQKLVQAFQSERNSVNKNQEGKQKASAQKSLQDHKFWSTQPVIKPGDGPISDEGPIEPNKPPSEVRSEPYPLPKDFEWVNVNIDDPTELQELFELLHLNYVEDDDATMRFRYTAEFLHWVLKHPGYRSEWHVGVRVTSSKKLVAFISGIPHELRVRETSYHSTEINFLCVHKKLRSKRLAPVLIKEVTRKCNLTGVFQAIYTGGIVLPTPISCSRYYHRTINPQKLCDVGFAAIPHNVRKETYFKKFDLENETKLNGLREMEEKDVGNVGKLMRRYMKRFDMAPRFTDDEIRHLFLSGRGQGEIDQSKGARNKQVTWTYVVENPETKVITDMFAFYSLPSSILNHPTQDVLHAAYLFYYASDTIFEASPPPPSTTNSTSTSNPTASTSTAEVEEWQRSSITGLNESELKDEENVTRWNDEPRELKVKLKIRLNELIHDLLILSKKAGFDVVNCLTVMDNQLFIQEQLFGPGDGFLRFYLFNWRVAPIAGGMGNRPGEADHDPLFSSLKENLLSKSNQIGSSSSSKVKDSGARLTSSEEDTLMESYPKAEWGSGNGIVMV